MCRPLRENLHFGGNAMYRTLLEGMWLSGCWVFIPIIYVIYMVYKHPISAGPGFVLSIRNYRFTIQYVTLVFVV